MLRSFACLLFAVLASWAAAHPRAQGPVPRGALDEILDLYVRDGLVYYRTLESDRSRLDRFVNALGSASLDAAPRDERLAFWLNAYNALVLRTVIDNYPIRQRSKEYPPRSIRQIPGAFERLSHRVAGRTVTLDEIEQTVLAEFQDPRVYFALGRGSMGGGRLRSEAYTPAALERQLSDVASECTTRAQCVAVDRAANQVMISAIFSWREDEFVAAYASKAAPGYAERSPIERAALAFVEPSLLTTERDFLEQNAFEVRYSPFDWTLNDLTGGRGR